MHSREHFFVKQRDENLLGNTKEGVRGVPLLPSGSCKGVGERIATRDLVLMK